MLKKLAIKCACSGFFFFNFFFLLAKSNYATTTFLLQTAVFLSWFYVGRDPPLGAYLCWAPPASPQHVQTPQLLSARVCWEVKRLGERRGFCLVCPASSPPLCNPEPGPSEMSGGGIGHDTLPFLQSLESQWKDFVVDKKTFISARDKDMNTVLPFLGSLCFLYGTQNVANWNNSEMSF